MKKTIGICGLGVVGQALENGFKPYHNIEVYDPPKGYDNIDGFVNKCDVIFVSLPTPMKRIKGGETDLTILDNVVGLIASRIVKSHKIIVIKSTIIPGTMSKYSRAFPGVNFVFNPEFLTEDNAIEDFKNQDRIVIASDKFKNSYKIGALYKKIFPGTPIMYTDFKEAFGKISSVHKRQLDIPVNLPESVKVKVSQKDISFELEKPVTEHTAHDINFNSSEAPVDTLVKDLEIKDSNLDLKDVDKKSSDIEISGMNEFTIG